MRVSHRQTSRNIVDHRARSCRLSIPMFGVMSGSADGTVGTSSQYMASDQRHWSRSQMSGPVAACSAALHRIGSPCLSRLLRSGRVVESRCSVPKGMARRIYVSGGPNCPRRICDRSHRKCLSDLGASMFAGLCRLSRSRAPCGLVPIEPGFGAGPIRPQRHYEARPESAKLKPPVPQRPRMGKTLVSEAASPPFSSIFAPDSSMR